MSVLNYFKNTPGRLPIGRQALSVIFFFKFATRSLEKKGGLSPPNGRQGGPVAPPSVPSRGLRGFDALGVVRYI